MELVDSAAVLILWWITLALTVVVIVPVAVYHLHRAWRAARMIQRYAAESLEASAGIAAHTSKVTALDDTIVAASPIVEKSEHLSAATGELEQILRQRAG